MARVVVLVPVAVLGAAAAVASADTQVGGSLGAGAANVDTVSDGHGPQGRAVTLAATGVVLRDVTGWLRAGGGLGVMFSLGLGYQRPVRAGRTWTVDLVLRAPIAEFGLELVNGGDYWTGADNLIATATLAAGVRFH